MAKMPQLNHSQMGIEIDKSEAEEMAKEALDTIINQAPK
jgi:hypothetical protein